MALVGRVGPTTRPATESGERGRWHVEERPTSRRRSGWAAHGGQYEYRVLTIDRSTSRSDASRLLTDEAEYGRWELARTRLYVGASAASGCGARSSGQLHPVSTGSREHDPVSTAG